MVAMTLVLPTAIVPPRFFRVQFLTALALCVIAALFFDRTHWQPIGTLALSIVFCLIGGIVWHTDEAPLGRSMMILATAAIGVTLYWNRPDFIDRDFFWLHVDDFASALTLGAAISAMLMGHSYLIAPAMSLSPLYRLLGVLAVALALRVGLACLGLLWWTRLPASGTLEQETTLWLAGRWILGLLFPIGLTWMAWETARIRSTQSATGILYVVTILVFLGELLSLLLAEKFGFPL